MTKEELQTHILAELEETEYHFHVMPHHGMIPDWFERYWDLWRLCYEYFHGEKPPYFPPDLCNR
jgi:hypothetical protein